MTKDEIREAQSAGAMVEFQVAIRQAQEANTPEPYAYALSGSSNAYHIVNPGRPNNEWTYCGRSVSILLSERPTKGFQICKKCNLKTGTAH